MDGTVRREGYLRQLHECRGPEVIKVITGMRRCGKSTLMDQFEEDLRAEGVDDAHIFHMNLESFEGREALSRDELEGRLKALTRDGTVYIMLDEIQEIEGWEMTVASLDLVKNFDIYLTGSNSNMLSTDLSTYISGRYIEVRMLPLSFKEYLELHPGGTEERFAQYVRYGGLPIADPSKGDMFCRQYLEGVFNTVLVKDVLRRLKTDDVGRITAIARFLYSNIGNTTNISAVSEGVGVSGNTAEKYVTGMEAALLFYHSEKYDIVGKKLLKTNGKFYASDTGLRFMALQGSGTTDMSRPIENIVFLELLRRGYTVRTGSYKDKEVDFTAIKGDEVEYYQVTQTMLSEETREREFGSLRPIRDNFPKTILTLDRLGLGTEGGIRVVNLYDWLLSRGPEHHPTDAHIQTG